MPNDIMNYNEFDHGSSTSTGGVTGSKKVINKDDGISYQLKPSIKDAPFIRRFKAGGSDKENFGEVISSVVSRALTSSNELVDLVPEVSLVVQMSDKLSSRVLVASKYLDKVEGTIDDYAKSEKGGNIKTKKRHVIVSGFEVEDNKNKDVWAIGGDENKQLRNDLAEAIAISALSGDHDVNPGNMMVIKDKEGKNRIARIDFGHAFNDLISFKSFGGKKHSENQVLDFVNREKVNKFPSGVRSKLWRDYSEIVPSKEMADAFKKMGESTKTQEGVTNAKAQFQNLVIEFNDDPKMQEHIKKSLLSINNNITGSKKINHKKVTIDQALDQTFNNLGDFYKKNQEQMLDVSKLMDMQVKIDQVLINKKNGKPVDTALILEIKKDYKEIEKNKSSYIGKGENKGINWVKNDKNTKAFKGDLKQFIKQRSIELKLDKSNNLILENEFNLPKKPNLITFILTKLGIIKNINLEKLKSENLNTISADIATDLPIPQEIKIEAKEMTPPLIKESQVKVGGHRAKIQQENSRLNFKSGRAM